MTAPRRQSEAVSLAIIATDISYMKNDISDIKATVQHGYVSKEEFEPIKKIVYGLVSLILIAVVGAVVSLVVR